MVYVGILLEKGVVVTESEAFEYAMNRIRENPKDAAEFEKEFGQQIVEWFFSGNFIERSDVDENRSR